MVKVKDGYWNNGLFLEQLKVAIRLHELLYPDYTAIFHLDHSSGHRKMAPDAPVASNMNRGPGGAQPFIRGGIGQCGAEALVRARGKYRIGMKLPDLIAILEQESEFLAARPI